MPSTDKSFANRKQQMLNNIGAIARVAKERSKPKIFESLLQHAEHLQRGELNVVVCGECRRGKSSLLNAFLETDGICPVDAPVTTNAITQIRHGESERIRVRTETPGKGKQTTEISRPEILHFVTEEENSSNGRKVELVEVQLPSSSLKDGLVLYDTPGVGSLNVAHTATTYGILPFADAVLFVGAANEPLTTPELRFLKDIAKHKPRLLHILTKRDAVRNSSEILEANLEKIAATLEAPREAVKGVSVSSKYKLEYIRDKDPETLELSGFQRLDEEIWDLLEKGGDLLLGRAQSQALIALSQLLPPIEAEYASLAATSKADLEALDARLKAQEERGRALMSGSQEWASDLARQGRNLSSQMRVRLGEVFDVIQDSVDGLLEEVEYQMDPPKLADRLVVECSNGFAFVVKEADERLGRVVQDLRKETSLNPSGGGVEASTDFAVRLLPPLPPAVTKMERASHFGSTVARNSGAFAALGSILGGVVGSVVPVVGTMAGLHAGALVGMAIGSMFGVKKGIDEVQVRDVETTKRALAIEVRKQLAQSRTKAASSLEIFLTDSLAAIDISLRGEIKGALDACSEARAALAATRSENAAETGKALREKETLIKNLYSWGKAISDLVPPQPSVAPEAG